jgi:hypothetical protein
MKLNPAAAMFAMSWPEFGGYTRSFRLTRQGVITR